MAAFTVLEEAEGAIYRMCTTADVSGVVACVSAAFKEGKGYYHDARSLSLSCRLTQLSSMLTGEPTTAAGGATEKDMTAFCQLFVPRMVDKSVIATNPEGAVIGAMLCKDWGDEDPEEEFAGFMAKLEGDWLPALTGIGECEETFNSDFGIPVEEKPKEKWFQLWNCGVDEQWRGRGVGKKLVGHR